MTLSTETPASALDPAQLDDAVDRMLAPARDLPLSLAQLLVSCLWLRERELPALPQEPPLPARVTDESERQRIRQELRALRGTLEGKLESITLPGEISPRPGIAALVRNLRADAGQWYGTAMTRVPTWAQTTDAAAAALRDRMAALPAALRELGRARSGSAAEGDLRGAVQGQLAEVLSAAQAMKDDAVALQADLNRIRDGLATHAQRLGGVELAYDHLVSQYLDEVEAFFAAHDLGVATPFVAAAGDLDPTVSRLRDAASKVGIRMADVEKKIDDETKTLIGFGAGGAVLTWITAGMFAPVFVGVMAGVGGDRLVQYGKAAQLEQQRQMLGYEISLAGFIRAIPPFVRRTLEVIALCEQAAAQVAKTAGDVLFCCTSMLMDQKSLTTLVTYAAKAAGQSQATDRIAQSASEIQRAVQPLKDPVRLAHGLPPPAVNTSKEG